MTDKKSLLKNQSTELEVVTGNVNYAAELKDEEATRQAHIQANKLRHNEQETNLSAVDAKMKSNKQGTHIELTSVSAEAKHNTKEVSVNITKVAAEKKAGGGNAKAVVTAANVTKDAQGNTRMTAITNAGAGQSVNIPAKGGGGVKLTREATVVTVDEQGQQQVYSIIRISAYSHKMRNERWFAWKNAEKLIRKIPKRPLWDFCKTISLLIFFTFLFLYPLITFLVNKEYVALNVISLIIGGIGFVEEIYDILIDVKKICIRYKCCNCGCCKSEDINNSDTEEQEDYVLCKCQRTINSCIDNKVFLSSVPRMVISFGMKVTLVYAGLICALMGFVNEKSWELRNISSYVDCCLLIYSIIVEAILPRFTDIRFVNDAIDRLQKDYHNARKMETSGCGYVCNRYFNPLGFAPIFGFLILILHLLMLGCIAGQLYADNFFTMNNTLTTLNMTQLPGAMTLNSVNNLSLNQTHEMEPKVGMYKVSGYTWFAIVAGIVVPILSIVSYFIINQYWIWQPLHYIGNHAPLGLSKRSFIESMSTGSKLMIYILDPIAWISMVLLLGSFITFAVFTIVADDGGHFPDFIDSIFTICSIGIFPVFIIANIQTVFFGVVLYYTLPCLCCLMLSHNFKLRL